MSGHWLNSKRVPIVGIVLTFVVGVILFLPFPGWQKFVGFITSATVLSYALVPPALIGMAVISWLGQYDGRDTIPFWWDIVVVALFSLAVYALALSVRLAPERTQELIGDLTAEAEEEQRELGAAPAH